MNRGLLIMSVILIITGVASSFAPLIILGIFLLLPALATRGRARTEQKKGLPQRTITAPESGQARQPPPHSMLEAPAQSPPLPEAKTYPYMLPPLFPSQVFPTLSPVQFEVQVPEEKSSEIEVPLELIGMIAIFFLGKILSKRR